MERNFKLISIIIIVLIVLVAIVGCILFFATDLLKSDEILFKKYLAQDIQNIAEVFDFKNEEMYLDYIKENDYTENTDITLSYIENENDQEEIYNIKTESINNTTDKSYYKNIKINYESEELSNIELLRQNEIYGFRLSDLVQQFVSIENATMYYVVTNLGYNGNYFVDEVPEFVVDSAENKSDVIQRALAEEEPVIEPAVDIQTQVPQDREIKIDLNHPESLPVPKSLKSYVISEGRVMSSQEAFDDLAINVNKEIMLEIPSLTDLSDRFLSHVPTIYSRVIIDEFDISDMSYMFLISSLLKQGVHIKTVPKVHTINLITDDSHAMIISEGSNDMEYGAIYNDRNSISNIRADFEKTWSIASNLDENILMANAGGAV